MANAPLGTMLRQLRTLAGAGAGEEASDCDLLERFVARRDEEAFVLLLQRHGAMVLQVCRRIRGNEHDAEDVFQATFLLLARKAGSIRKRESVASWLHGVAHRLALAARGQGARRQARERRAADMRRTPETPDEAWQELQATLDEALRQVPQTYRTPLLLCYLQGKTQEEAARQLGCPVGTVRSRLARGRSRLRTILERQGLQLSAAALATALLGSSARAVVRRPLLSTTARAALAYAQGQAAEALVSAAAAALLEGGKIMTGINLRIATMVVLVVSGLGLGAAVLAMRSPTPAAPPASAARPALAPKDRPAPRDTKADEGVKVHGRVLGPDGKPVSGARLLVPRLRKDTPTSHEDIVTERAGHSDAQGRFSVTAPRIGATGKAYVIAHASGLGVDWVELDAGKKAAEATLRLPKDVPITGRVVNTENRPIAGVSVYAVGISVPPGDDLDAYLEGWLHKLQDTLASTRRHLPVGLDSITGAVTTDKEGRFTIHGAGAERIVRVTFSGAGIARSSPYVITRPGLDTKPYNAALRKKENDELRVLNRFLGMYPPTLTFVAEPGKIIEGVITDGASGKPLPACRVFTSTGYGDGVGTVTDTQGKYRLEGIPKNSRGYGVSILPPKGTTYMSRMASAPDNEGYARVRIDVAVVRGAVVRGRVVDRQTGKGVSAGIRFAPLPDNKFFGSRPGFDNYRHDRTMAQTEKDGRFRLLTIPGTALVMVQVHQGETFHGQYLNPYRRARPDPDHKDLFKYDEDDDSWTLSSAGGLEFLSTENAVKVIDVKPDGETEVELFVERGATGRIRVQDADGKPLAGAWVAGLADHWPITYQLPGAEAKVYALDGKKPRRVFVFHPGKKLGGTATIRGDEKGAVVVKLAPVGSVSGRLLEGDGTPLSRAEVSINPQSQIGRELYRFATPTGKALLTDAEGRFTLSGVVPGMPFFLGIRKGEHFYAGKPKIGVLQLKAGESLDVGERKMELLR